MQSQSSSPQQEIVSVITDGLRVFQRRRDQRRSHSAEVYGASMTSAASAPTAASPRPASPSHSAQEDPTQFCPVGYVEVNGRAVPVVDPATLERLQELAARGIVPPPDIFKAGFAAASFAQMTGVDPQVASAVSGFHSPGAPAPTPANTVSDAAQDDAPNPSPDSHHTSSTELPRCDDHSDTPDPALGHIEHFIARRADEEAARLSVLLHEHEARLAQQAEFAAKQQAALLREVLEIHRTEQADQASRHAHVVRDLLREHQCQLDERTMAAVTREAQAIGTLLREHRDTLAEANEAHRRELEEILEHHQGDLHAARGAQGGVAVLHAFLAEQAKLQREAHALFASGLATLAAKVEQFGVAVQQLAETATAPRPDLSWLAPPSFVPPLPKVPVTPSLATPEASVDRPAPVTRPGPEPPAVETRVPAMLDADATAARLEAPDDQARPESIPTTTRRPSPVHERESVHSLMDEVYSDGDDDIEGEDDDEIHHLAPLTPTPLHC